jgi:hypothetical protein
MGDLIQGVTNTFRSKNIQKIGKKEKMTWFVKEEKTPNEFFFQVESKSK